MNTINVLIAIESQFMGDVFTDILADEIDISVAGCATTLSQALGVVRDHDPNVVLVSIHFPDALEVIGAIKETAPTVKILALGLSDDKNQVLRCVEAGAAGYILQDSSVQELIESLRMAQREEARVSTNIAAALLVRVSKMSKFFGSRKHLAS